MNIEAEIIGQGFADALAQAAQIEELAPYAEKVANFTAEHGLGFEPVELKEGLSVEEYIEQGFLDELGNCLEAGGEVQDLCEKVAYEMLVDVLTAGGHEDIVKTAEEIAERYGEKENFEMIAKVASEKLAKDIVFDEGEVPLARYKDPAALYPSREKFLRVIRRERGAESVAGQAKHKERASSKTLAGVGAGTGAGVKGVERKGLAGLYREGITRPGTAAGAGKTTGAAGQVVAGAGSRAKKKGAPSQPTTKAPGMKEQVLKTLGLVPKDVAGVAGAGALGGAALGSLARKKKIVEQPASGFLNKLLGRGSKKVVKVRSPKLMALSALLGALGAGGGAAGLKALGGGDISAGAEKAKGGVGQALKGLMG